MPFPTLDGFGPTRRTLQLYSRALSGLARVHGVAHPNWWHISPVSYTHLDVYKRQALVVSSRSFTSCGTASA